MGAEPVNVFKIPEEPVDGFTIHWWELWCDHEHIMPCAATYHVNTKWEDYAPTDPYDNGIPGTDLVDDWMCYENGSASYRVVGWKNIGQCSDREAYPSEEAAIQARRKELKDKIERMQDKIARLSAILANG